MIKNSKVFTRCPNCLDGGRHLRDASSIYRDPTSKPIVSKGSVSNILVPDTPGHTQMIRVCALTSQSYCGGGKKRKCSILGQWSCFCGCACIFRTTNVGEHLHVSLEITIRYYPSKNNFCIVRKNSKLLLAHKNRNNNVKSPG